MSAPPSSSSTLEAEVRDLVRRVVEDFTRSGDPAEAPAPILARAEPRPTDRTLALGADHGGFGLKQTLSAGLREAGWEIVDCGTHSEASVDYPDLALAVAEKVARGECRWGIVIDGAGIGSAMVANKVPGIRAALCYDLSSARNSREHNHANVLTLGAGLIGSALARQIVDTWLATPWGPDRHARRVEKITTIEARYVGAAQSSTGCRCQHG